MSNGPGNGKGNGQVNGHGAVDGPEDAGESAADALGDAMPAPVAELAAACVRFAATKYGVPLDFTSDTLGVVDQYVRDARAELAGRSPAEREVHLGLIQASIGAYLGEVIRRAHGGFWVTVGDHDAWRVRMSSAYLEMNPIGMAREALLMEAQDGWNAHLASDPAEREELAARLARLPEVDEDEYFAPSTRFDVVAMAMEHLTARLRAQGLGDVTFSPDDYG